MRRPGNASRRWRAIVLDVIRVLLLLLALLLVACRETASPAKPVYVRGPGCTVVERVQLTDSIAELLVHRFPHCVEVLWDSTLVAPAP